LGIDNASRGIFFGGPALILPIFANYAAKKDQFWPLSAMILSSGILIVLGGIVMSGEYILKQSMQEISQEVTLREMEWRSYDPVLFEVGMLISIGGFQILLAVKQLRIISRSAHGV
jgi:branched-subunit amino acid permease